MIKNVLNNDPSCVHYFWYSLVISTPFNPFLISPVSVSAKKTWKNNLRVLSEVQAPVECVVSMLPGQWWCRTECNPNPCQYAAQNPRFSRARLLYNTRILCLLPILLNSSHFIAFSRKAFRACW